jgi:DNA-binding NtrC family response regulator
MAATMIAGSESMRKVTAVIDRVAPTDASIFLWGETGVGREFVAERIHEQSRRAGGPWIAFNWATIPVFLEHAQLFGTAADADSPDRRPGLLERATGGTLFLDEIPLLSLENQAELLRVLQAGRFRPAGADHDVPLDVRLISTCCDPRRAVADGELRADLCEHLSAVSLELPPLRWRHEDIPALAEHFLRDSWGAGDLNGQPPPRVAEDALQLMREKPWPGNLRQFEVTMILIAADAAPGQTITAADVPWVG